MSRIITFSKYGGPDVLDVSTTPTRAPGPTEVVVAVSVAGVNPVDCKLRRGDMSSIVAVTFPKRLGNEFAGVISLAGDEVTGLCAGDEVLGWSNAEAYADEVVVPADQLVVKPPDLSWEIAGGLSAVGQTAMNSLRELRVTRGETLLVHAAGGGVGTVATQLAAHDGVTVIGTARPENHEYLRGLGAIAVPYGPDLVEQVRKVHPGPIDAALDAIGGDAVCQSTELVANRERIGTIVDQEAADRYGTRRLRGLRSTAILADLARRCAIGELVVPITGTFALDEVAEAHRVVETGHVRGKVVLRTR